MQKEKIRVYVLARELNVDSKILLDLCKQAGFDVKNQLSNLEPEQRDALETMMKSGGSKPAAGAPAPAKPVLPSVLPEQRSIRNLNTRPARSAQAPRPEDQPAEPEAPAAEEQPEEPEAPPPVTTAPRPAAAEAAPLKPTLLPPRPTVLPSVGPSRVPNLGARPGGMPQTRPPQVRPPAPPAVPAAGPSAPPTGSPPSTAPQRPAAASGAPGAAPPRPTGTPSPRPVPNLGRTGGGPPGSIRTPLRRPGQLPPGLAAVPHPPRPLKQLQPMAPKGEKVATPLKRLTPEQMTQTKPIRVEDLLKPTVEAPGGTEVVDETEDDRKGGKGGPGAKKAIPGREDRRRERQERAEKRKKTEVKVVGGKLVSSDDETKGRTLHHPGRRLKRPGTIKPTGPVILEPPFTVRSLSAALGVNSVELLFKLKDHGVAGANINSTVDVGVAELVALDYGKEVVVKKALDAEDELLEGLKAHEDKPEELAPRAPIVTIMGHVDHGKTTLLDKIRASNVAASEAGGITQVIRAWRVDHGGRPITFLDTPGHEAFTKMRARGANVTDIAVIVVAADDGVMPQTEEAISHAKAAGVSLVVAINKVDMPSANVTKTRQQLYSLNVLPDDMGGDTPFVETSAATGKGIDELLDQISIVAELKELKANPNKAGTGTCLEAMLSEGEGVQATLLVRDGTLRRGDVLLCGHAYGRIRQMYDDLGRPLEEAGPTIPVRITGLDEVPNADDTFNVLPDLSVAREIAEKRKAKIAETSKTARAPLSLERLGEAKIVELKVILKADFRGSVEAIKKELEKLVHAEVRVRVLHAAIGGITESDVQLALTSPEDTVIVGFNVVPDDRALSLAEEKGVQIREYDIIYNLTNDIRAALEGKLKPREEVVHLGRAVIRETFKISKVGTIAGCYVTTGNIKRNAKIRVIRDGVVIYPPADRTAGLDSLKRFKEDVGEVREGFECGMKIAGYDDIKVGDVIEAFRVEQVQRTLE